MRRNNLRSTQAPFVRTALLVQKMLDRDPNLPFLDEWEEELVRVVCRPFLAGPAKIFHEGCGRFDGGAGFTRRQ